MVDTSRIAQLVTESVGAGNPETRLSQLVTETISVGEPEARLSQLVAESVGTGTPETRLSQLAVEIIIKIVPIVISIDSADISVTGKSYASRMSYLLSSGALSITGNDFLVDLSNVIEARVGSAALTISGARPVVRLLSTPEFEVAEFDPIPVRDTTRDNDGQWVVGVDEDPSWDFTEQRNLPIPYHEHPTKAEVCGHWHKPLEGPGILCIEFVEEFETVYQPESSGSYNSRDNMVFLDGFVIGSAVNSGSMFKFDPSRNVFVNDTTFDVSDVSGISQIEYYDGFIYALINRDGYIGKWIQKISIPVYNGGSFVLVGAPMYAGNAVRGTDNKIYGALEGLNLTAGVWRDLYTPTVGAGWEGAWEELPEDYSDNYHVYEDLEGLVDIGLDVAIGAICINFKIIPDEGFIISTGPSSTFLANTAIIGYVDFTAKRKHVFIGNTIIGPNELAQNSDAPHRLALLRCTSAFTNLIVRILDADSFTSFDVPVTGLVDAEGLPKDNSIYHARTIWHPDNDRIYNLHSVWPETWGRIIALSPSGRLLYQYIIDSPIGQQSFAVLGPFVYIWQDGIHGHTHESAIIKLTLDLEFVCIEDCSGIMHLGRAREFGGSIISNGDNKLFNFAPSALGGGAITTYQVNPGDGGYIGGKHDPVWDFVKQPNKD